MAWGAAGLFLIALLDSSFVPMPGGADALVLLFAASNPQWSWLYVVTACLGSLVGTMVIYYLSKASGGRMFSRYDGTKRDSIKRLIDRYDVAAVFVASILPPPFPFKLFVITAGIFRFSVLRFAIAILIGRAFRFMLEGFVAARYGAQAKALVAQHYYLIGLGFAVLLLSALLPRRFVFKKRRSKVDAEYEIPESPKVADGV